MVLLTQRAAESLLLKPPTAEERLVIHKLIYTDRKALETMDKIVFERKYANMDSTGRQSTVIMFPQVFIFTRSPYFLTFYCLDDLHEIIKKPEMPLIETKHPQEDLWWIFDANCFWYFDLT